MAKKLGSRRLEAPNHARKPTEEVPGDHENDVNVIGHDHPVIEDHLRMMDRDRKQDISNDPAGVREGDFLCCAIAEYPGAIGRDHSDEECARPSVGLRREPDSLAFTVMAHAISLTMAPTFTVTHLSRRWAI
jgi:hypothetical protein